MHLQPAEGNEPGQLASHKLRGEGRTEPDRAEGIPVPHLGWEGLAARPLSTLRVHVRVGEEIEVDQVQPRCHRPDEHDDVRKSSLRRQASSAVPDAKAQAIHQREDAREEQASVQHQVQTPAGSMRQPRPGVVPCEAQVERVGEQDGDQGAPDDEHEEHLVLAPRQTLQPAPARTRRWRFAAERPLSEGACKAVPGRRGRRPQKHPCSVHRRIRAREAKDKRANPTSST
mmetsp:Transcript_81290/g.263665  ORF Transcript_81290/g.263665 Transcript_81290/m.263665 type:complete len:229 (-) Transcript_81290:1479-2165(-)